MKNVKFLNGWLFACVLFFAVGVLQAQMTVKGKVTDANNKPVAGALVTVVEDGNLFASTDEGGNYSIEVPKTSAPSGKINLLIQDGDGKTLSEKSIAYQEGVVTQNVGSTKAAANTQLAEVKIGYGSVKKKDATGSVALITEDDFNKGAVVNSEQLIQGKAAGVRIVTSGGQPDANVDLRVRGGASLTANNKPLIVIDGVPISDDNPAGVSNPLSLVNPNDVESFSVLKDASATAIYGSRASNGVIIITTKKGKKGKPKYQYNGTVQLSTLPKQIDVMSGDEYASFIRTYYPNREQYLGVNVNGQRQISNVNWQKEIYNDAISHDHNFSASAGLINGKLPIRASIGYGNYEGILKTYKFERMTAALNLTPSLLNDHLKFEINSKFAYSEKNSPDEGAIGSALNIDPTKPIYDPNGDNLFGGYYRQRQLSNNLLTVGTTNPLAQLLQRQRPEIARRFIGNAKVDYKFHFLPELVATVNVGLDKSNSDIEEILGDNAIAAYNNNIDNLGFRSGTTQRETQDVSNTTLDLYGTYTKSYENVAVSKFMIQGGYSYQNFDSEGSKLGTTINDLGNRIATPEFKYVNLLNLQSFFGRLNLDFVDKYLFTFSYRSDASSLFPENLRWGHFPAAAFAWKANEEDWLKDFKEISSLKLRLGWGLTGQQNITGVSYYPYTALYLGGNQLVQYQLGDVFYTTYRANPYAQNLTWEKTSTYNMGVDFGFFNNRVSGTLDTYFRKTTDLLADAPTVTNLKNTFIDNIGSTSSKGIEFLLNVVPVKTEKLTWELNGNIAYNDVKIDELERIDRIRADGNIGRGTGSNIAFSPVGFAPRQFFMYEQIYDTYGNPIEGAFVDRNQDGKITEDDRYYVNSVPRTTYGFGTSIYFGDFDLVANFRGQVGGKIYNANLANRGFRRQAILAQQEEVLNNVLSLYNSNTFNGFENVTIDEAFSDYYLSDASFLRFDNVTLGYKFKKFFKDNISLRIYGSVNNVFVVSNYDGLDPENFGGIEQSPYARPRIYTFGANLNF